MTYSISDIKNKCIKKKVTKFITWLYIKNTAQRTVRCLIPSDTHRKK